MKSHTYLMMNFLAVGRYDSAAVEARRALERIADKESVLEQDAFTRALIALSFEMAGQANDWQSLLASVTMHVTTKTCWQRRQCKSKVMPR